MDESERMRVSEFKKRYPDRWKGKSDEHILLCLKFIDAGKKLVREKLEEMSKQASEE